MKLTDPNACFRASEPPSLEELENPHCSLHSHCAQASLLLHPMDTAFTMSLNGAAHAAAISMRCGHTKLSLSRPVLDTGASSAVVVGR